MAAEKVEIKCSYLIKDSRWICTTAMRLRRRKRTRDVEEK